MQYRRRESESLSLRAAAGPALMLAGVAAMAIGVGVAFEAEGGGTEGVGVVRSRDAFRVAATSTTRGSEESVVRAMREEESGAAVSREEAARQLGALPVVFVKNEGQWPSEVKFGARGHGVAAAFTERGLTLSAPARDEAGAEWIQAVAFDFFGGRKGREPTGERKLRGVHNYFLGNDPSNWRAGVPLYEAVRYDEVAPGIAMVVTDRDGRLEYDLHVDPGADLGRVEVTCKGADSIAIEPDGSLRLETKAGAAVQSPPKAWYELAGGGTRVADCRFRLTGPMSYGFEVLDPDPGHKLIVDPTVGLTWSTFLGTSSDDAIYGVDFLSGKVTMVGTTAGSGFPTSSGAFDTSHNGGQDAFVTQLDPAQSGTAELVWSTFLGGSSDDLALSVDLKSGGEVAVCGKTKSSNFPTSSNPHAASILTSGVFNAFVSYLNSTGTTLTYSTYYGSSNGQSRANSVKIDTTPEITIVGYVEGSGLHKQNAYDTDYDGGGDAFVARFDPAVSGSASLTYGSYIGDGFGGFSASDYDEAFAVDLDGGKIFIAGTTEDDVFSSFHTQFKSPYTVVYDTSHNGARDCFLMIVDPAQTGSNQLRYATFLGGELDDEALGLSMDSDVFHACGYTQGGGFPASSADNTNGVYDSSKSGTDRDAFLTKLDPNGSSPTNQLRYSTFLGGSSDDAAYSIARVQDQSDLIVGVTASTDFPTGAVGGSSVFQTSLGGGTDAFLSRLTWKNNRIPANQLEYSTYLGGSSNDEARSLVLDGSVEAYFGGLTLSSGFPTAGTPYDSSYNGGSSTGDGFACWFTMPPVTSP